MKYFLLFFLISHAAIAQDQLIVRNVLNLEFMDQRAIVTFNDTGVSYKIPENDKVIPCLKNAWLAQQQVILKMDANQTAIMDCKLYAGGLLEMETTQGPPKVQKEAQESREKSVKKP